MITFVNALKTVSKAIAEIKTQDPTLSSAYLLAELKQVVKLQEWEGYDASVPFLSNLRSLMDIVLRGEGATIILAEQRQKIGDLGGDFIEPYLDWEEGRVDGIVRRPKGKKIKK